MPKSLAPVIKIAKYTLTDEVRQKSFIVMFVICILFVLSVRGCYRGEFIINGQEVGANNVVTMVSKMTFHAIAVGVMFLSALLSMRVFRRDRADGTHACILSKPITRRQYVAGKILGLWVLTTAFMFFLHGMVFFITLIKLHIVMPEYLAASLICSVNLIFVIITVFLFTLMMPDIAALLSFIGIGIIGLIADGLFAMSRSPMGQMMMQERTQSDLTLWQAVYYVWPKISGTEKFASSFIGADPSGGFVSVYPLMNILTYCVVLGVLLFWRFQKEDIV
jgi:ABC-type transport system involved in multi-copper enzyme maturation permease subunit